MTIDPDKFNILLKAVEMKFGSKPNSPLDFELLGATIAASVKRTISASTLKRLWGYSKAETSPTYSTLSLLCRYVGYADWDAFSTYTPAGELAYETSAFTQGKIIAATEIPQGTRYRLRWHPNKSLTLIKLSAPCRFRVEEAVNIKLQVGDIVEIDSIAIGLPLHASSITRNGEQLGHYYSARQSGLTTIIKL